MELDIDHGYDFLIYSFAKRNARCMDNCCQGKVSRVYGVQSKAQCYGVFGMENVKLTQEKGLLIRSYLVSTGR